MTIHSINDHWFDDREAFVYGVKACRLFITRKGTWVFYDLSTRNSFHILETTEAKALAFQTVTTMLKDSSDGLDCPFEDLENSVHSAIAIAEFKTFWEYAFPEALKL